MERERASQRTSGPGRERARERACARARKTLRRASAKRRAECQVLASRCRAHWHARPHARTPALPRARTPTRPHARTRSAVQGTEAGCFAAKCTKSRCASRRRESSRGSALCLDLFPSPDCHELHARLRRQDAPRPGTDCWYTDTRRASERASERDSPSEKSARASDGASERGRKSE